MARARGRVEAADTASRILDVAERLAQTRGFNGFSYADIAAELKISKPSLHYHFPSKAALGEALIARYADRFAGALGTIDERGDSAAAKLAAYAGIYADVLKGHRMCLCGMLAADYETLPKPMRKAVVGFFDENETWLTRVLEAGHRGGLAASERVRERGGASDRGRPRGSPADRATLQRRGPIPSCSDPAADRTRRRALARARFGESCPMNAGPRASAFGREQARRRS